MRNLGTVMLIGVLSVSMFYSGGLIHKYKIGVEKQVDSKIVKFVKEFSVRKLAEDQIAKRKQELAKREVEAAKEREVEKELVVATRSDNRGRELGMFNASAYDLSIKSCGKSENHPAYGITASGFSLKGHDRESAMTIATDPKIIPMGTKVYLEFEDEWQHWNGVYTARDKGGAIKGKKIDIFFKDSGDSKTDQIVWNFGRREVRVTILD